MVEREPPAYAELHCRSNFSFLQGASHPEELVAQAAAYGYRALALTDLCSVAGVVRAHRAARRHGLKLIVGAEFALADLPLRFVLLAPDRAAYGRLCTLISAARRAAPKGTYRLDRALLRRHRPEGCIALWLPAIEDEPAAGRCLAELLGETPWVAVTRRWDGRDRRRFAQAERLAALWGRTPVAVGGVRMHRPARRRLFDVLCAVHAGRPLAELGHALARNAAACLQPRTRLARLYPAAWLDNAVQLAERCTFTLDSLRYEYPREIVPAGYDADGWLREQVRRGARRRYPDGVPPAVHALLDKELALIAELELRAVFPHRPRHGALRPQPRHPLPGARLGGQLGGVLTAWGSPRWTRRACECCSNGSSRAAQRAARHRRRLRARAPRGGDRSTFIAKYGRDRAALAATVITYRPGSAVRDVGKALGLSPGAVDALASAGWWDGRAMLPERCRDAGFDPATRMVRRCARWSSTLCGFPRHLSQHVGGFVIARDRCSRMVPIENAAMPERTVIQWDKDDLDALGC
ncbi:MAG: hypothetical protein KatS3mg121_1281 [Gammaproteobacteria bacterium]|nr:MAG: hypothetical protein KatS3mg121_1281 [Gammaproteobacteria bacterium]